MTIKTYEIYCITKANGHQYLHRADISAENVKEAKDCMKRIISTSTGRHPFSVATKPAGGWNWDVVAKRLGMTLDQLKVRSVRDGGIEFA